MTTPSSNLIHCPGCNIVVKATQAACPGCGSCLRCGSRRSTNIKECPKCKIPYCECCGVCAGCGNLRYSFVGACSCGHPDNSERVKELVRYNAVHDPEKYPLPIGCTIALATFVVIIALIVGYLVL